MIDHGRRTSLTDEIGSEFVAELTQSFWSDGWPLLEQSIACEATGDVASLRRVLHTLAGSAGNIGFTGIAAAAEAAGLAVKAGGQPDLGRVRDAMSETSTILETRDAA